MQIQNLQPALDRGSGNMRAIAYFDLELSDDVRMYGLRLMQAPDGRRVVYAANANGGRRTATFAPTLAAAISAAAATQLEGHVTANDRY